MVKNAFIFFISLIIVAIFGKWITIIPDQKFVWYLIFFVSIVIITKIGEYSWGKIVSEWKFRDTKNKLEGESLRLYANECRGLPFTTLNNLGADALRHLITLQLIKAEIFPVTLNFIYYLTDLGRKLLKKDLRYALYPEILCDMCLIRFWKGYNEKGYRDFDKKKVKFKNDYQISWEGCVAILREQLREKGLKISEEDDDVVKMFDDYRKDKDFLFVMKDLIEPWVLKVEGKRKPKDFRLFKPLKNPR